MKVFLTGATGFIGQRLTGFLLDRGIAVKAYIRSPEKAARILPGETEVIPGSLFDREGIRKALSGCDAVIHCAAIASMWEKDKSVFERVNVEATGILLEAVRTIGIQTFVHISTAGVYGPARNGTPVSESAGLSDLYFTEYDRTKIAAETLVHQYASEMTTITLNITRVFGPGLIQNSNSITQLLIQFRAGKWRLIPGNGQQYGNYVFIDDVIASIHKALFLQKSGEGFIVGGENVTFNALFRMFRELTGQSRTMFRMPLFLGQLFGHLEVIRAKAGQHQPVITPQFAKRYYYDWVFDSSKAQRELDHTITPLREALIKTIQWLDTLDSAERNRFIQD